MIPAITVQCTHKHRGLVLSFFFFLGSAFVTATKLLHPLVLVGTKELTRINVEMQIKSHQQFDIIQSLMKS